MHNKDLWSVLLFLEAAGASGRCVVPEEEAEVTRQKSVKLIGSTSEGIRHPLKAPQHYVSASFSSVRSQQKKSLLVHYITMVVASHCLILSSILFMLTQVMITVLIQYIIIIIKCCCPDDFSLAPSSQFQHHSLHCTSFIPSFKTCTIPYKIHLSVIHCFTTSSVTRFLLS